MHNKNEKSIYEISENHADLLVFVCGFNCVFVTFPCGILGQVWYLIVLIPDYCHFLTFVLYG